MSFSGPKRFALSLSFVLALLGHNAFAQVQCLDGIVQLPLNVNGTVRVCGAVAAQAPALSQQLSDIVRSLSTQQDQLRDLNRLVKGLNSLSQNIGPGRQAQLGVSLSSRLSQGQKAGKEQTQRQIADLADASDNLRDQLLAMLTNQATAARANAAVSGPVGDAIAKLDLSTAHDLLEDIRTQLNAIGSQVGEVNQRTIGIQQTLDQAKVDSESQKRQADQAAAEQARKMQLDPAMFARVNVAAMSFSSTYGGKWQLSAQVVPVMGGSGAAFLEASLQMVFAADGPKPQAVTFTDRQMLGPVDIRKAYLEDLPDTAVVCFIARDPRNGNKLRLTQAFAVQKSENQVNRTLKTRNAAFVPSRPATLMPDSDAACR